MLTAAPVLQHQSDLILFCNSLRANWTLTFTFSIPCSCERGRVRLGRIRVDHVRRHPRSEEDNDLGQHRLRNLHGDLDRAGTCFGQRPKGLRIRGYGERFRPRLAGSDALTGRWVRSRPLSGSAGLPLRLQYLVRIWLARQVHVHCLPVSLTLGAELPSLPRNRFGLALSVRNFDPRRARTGERAVHLCQLGEHIVVPLLTTGKKAN